MKKITFAVSLLLLLASGASAQYPAVSEGGFGVSFGVFYSSLDRYGEWIEMEPGYYAWRPLHMGSGWRPYVHGHWAWTDDGWFWVTDEPWGWATYHYGRWYYDDYYGWMWIPGYDWAPAWVEWRYSDDVIGWAPLGPYAVFSVNFGITYHHAWVTPYHYWSFVHIRYLCSPTVYQHLYRGDENGRYIGRTRLIGSARYERNRVVMRGPERAFIEQRTGVRVGRADVVPVRDRSGERVVRQGDRESIRVYRPAFDSRTSGANIDRPGKVRTAERRSALDLRGTDLEQRSKGQSDRGIAKPQETPRIDRSSPKSGPTRLQQTTPQPGARSRQTDSGERAVRPRSDVQGGQIERKARSVPQRVTPQPQNRRADQNVRPQVEQKRTERLNRATQPQVERKREVQQNREVRRNQSRSAERPRNEGSRKRER